MKCGNTRGSVKKAWDVPGIESISFPVFQSQFYSVRILHKSVFCVAFGVSVRSLADLVSCLGIRDLKKKSTEVT